MSSIFSRLSFFVRPTKYKASKLYSVIPANGAGDLSVTRAGTKFRMNSAGILESVANNVPAIDWRGATPAYNGLLVERAATNLILRSEQFSDSLWVKTDLTVTANTDLAPDNNLTADTITEGVATSRHSLNRTFTTIANNVYCASAFVKKGTARFVSISMNSAGNSALWVAAKFDLDNPTAATATNGAGGGTVLNSGIIALGNGWFRIFVSGSIGSNTDNQVFCAIANNGTTFSGNNRGAESYTGTSRTHILWGVHCELGSSPSSYIATVAATASRVADAISKTGIAPYLNNTDREGTIFFCIRRDIQTSGAELMSFTQASGSVTNQLLLRTTATDQIEAVVVNGGSEVVNILSSTNQSGVLRITFAYKDNDCQLYINGVSAGTDTGVTIPGSLDEVYLGGVNVANNANFWLKCLAVHPKRLTTAEIQAVDAQLATAVT